MNEKKQILVSKFDSVKSNKSYTVVNIHQWLLSDHLQGVVDKIRTTRDEGVRQTLKCKLPAITPSGVFHKRNNNGLIEPSFLICIDIDGKDNPSISNMEELKGHLSKLPYVMYCGLSASGTGLFCIIPYIDHLKHKLYFNAIEQEFKAMGVIIDKSCSDIARLRLGSCDGHPYFNLDAVSYEKTLDDTKIKEAIKVELSQNDFVDNQEDWGAFVASEILKPTNLNLARVVPQSQKDKVVGLIHTVFESNVDITRKYQDWFLICCIIKNCFGEGGRGLFHAVSRLYPSYTPEETDKLYSSIKQWQYRYRTDRLFEIAAKYGFK